MNISFSKKFVAVLVICGAIMISALALGYESFALAVLDRVLGAAE